MLGRGFHRLALAASTAAIALAQVARIKCTNPGSRGSRPSLGGGSAAKDRHRRAAPQRRAVPSQSVFINVQGKSRFTVDEVNDLMEKLIERPTRWRSTGPGAMTKKNLNREIKDAAASAIEVVRLLVEQMRQQGQSDAEILAALDRLERDNPAKVDADVMAVVMGEIRKSIVLK